jgi:hypothetical protein
VGNPSLARLLRITTLMVGFPAPWYVAGGWALDLFLGRLTRPHADVDVALFRADQSALRAYLDGWEWMKAIPGQPGRLDPWIQGQELTLPVHELHARKAAEMARGPTLEAEFLLNESDGINWIFRREPSIMRSLTRIGRRSPHGIPILAPEVVLLYKAPRFKAEDDHDLQTVAPALDPDQRRWLRNALRVYQPGHVWIASL